MSLITGNHVVVLKNQMVFAANELEPIGDEVVIRLRGIESRIRADDIEIIYETGKDTSFPIDPAIVSALATLEKGIAAYEQAGGRKSAYTICGSSSLALTIIPDRATEDIDIVTSEPIDEFLNWDIAVEFIDDTLLSLMGAWRTRTSTAIGLTGHQFQVMHPLDTVMQKLLRWDPEKFAQKDHGDIEQIISTLKPTKDTLKKLLTENPFRYINAIGPLSIASTAITENTKWFIANFLPGTTLPEIVQAAHSNYTQKLSRAKLAPVTDIDLRSKIRKSDLDMG